MSEAATSEKSAIKRVNTILVVGLLIAVALCIYLQIKNKEHIIGIPYTSDRNLNGIGKAIYLYSAAYDDTMPTTPELLVTEGYASAKMFCNPEHLKDMQPSPEVIDGKFNFDPAYVIFLDFPAGAPGSSIMGYEKIILAHNGKVWFLTLNGAVNKITIADLNAQLKKENRPPAE